MTIFFFFFLALTDYMIRAARVIDVAVFSSSFLQSWRLYVKGMLTGHTSSLAALCKEHLSRT